MAGEPVAQPAKQPGWSVAAARGLLGEDASLEQDPVERQGSQRCGHGLDEGDELCVRARSVEDRPERRDEPVVVVDLLGERGEREVLDEVRDAALVRRLVGSADTEHQRGDAGPVDGCPEHRDAVDLGPLDDGGGGAGALVGHRCSLRAAWLGRGVD